MVNRMKQTDKIAVASIVVSLITLALIWMTF